MSIGCYTGFPGSGKTLQASQKMLEELSIGKYVVSNYMINNEYYEKTLNKNFKARSYDENRHSKKYKKAKYELFDKFIYCQNSMLTPKLLYDISLDYFAPKKMSQCLLVLDEASLIFNSRTWNEKGRDDWIRFFKLHRKLGYDIILIEQNIDSIDKQIKANIEHEYLHRAINKFGNMQYLSLFGIQAFAQVRIWRCNNQKDDSKLFFYRRYYNKLYDTYEVLFV